MIEEEGGGESSNAMEPKPDEAKVPPVVPIVTVTPAEQDDKEENKCVEVQVTKEGDAKSKDVEKPSAEVKTKDESKPEVEAKPETEVKPEGEVKTDKEAEAEADQEKKSGESENPEVEVELPTGEASSSAETEEEEEPTEDTNEDDEEEEEDGEKEEEEVEEEEMVRAPVRNNVDKWVEYLDRTDPAHKLRSLCKKGDTDALKAFLSNKDNTVDINAVSEEGWTCLHEIITHECQFTEVAKILVEYGASVNTQDLHGDSPLHSALLYHNADNISLLVGNAADFSLMNGAGRMPLHVADEAETLRIMLDSPNCKVDLQDRVGNGAIHYAVVSKDKERIALILDNYSPNVNLQNRSGSTPLHLTADLEVATMLLKAGADPNVSDLNGNTSLHAAVRGRHKDIVRLLLEHKADASRVNNSGKTPVNLAKDREMRNILAGKAGPESGSPTPTASGTKKAGAPKKEPLNKFDHCLTPKCLSPGILKRKRSSFEMTPDDPTKRKGPRLKFSEVNDYSGVEVVSEEKRVKVPPIYREPKFSSEDED